MIKSDLIEEVCAKTGLTKEQASKAIEATMEVIKKSLTKGHSISLRGFGTFEPKVRKQKLGRNINTGTSVVVPERAVPFFRPSAEFKSQVGESKNK